MKRGILTLALVLMALMVGAAVAHADSGKTTDRLNLREKPSTKARILTTLPEGATVEINSAFEGGWYQVTTQDGRFGYVKAEYVKRGSEEKGKNSYEATVKVNSKFREGPGTKYPSIKVIKQGQSVTVLGKSGQWLEITYKGTNGYIFQDLVSVTNQKEEMYQKFDTKKETGFTVKALTHVNLREGPGSEHEVMGVIRKGNEAKVIDRKEGWLKVSYHGKTGWTYSQYYEVLE